MELARSRRFALALVFAASAVVVASWAAYTQRLPAFLGAQGVDKIGHGTMGAVLTYLLARVLRGRALLASLLVLVPVGADEYLQRFSPARTSDWADFAADTIGAALAVAIVYATRVKKA